MKPEHECLHLLNSAISLLRLVLMGALRADQRTFLEQVESLQHKRDKVLLALTVNKLQSDLAAK